MEFRTTLPTPSSHLQLQLHDGAFTIGSCFAEHLGNRLHRHKFKCLINPFGTVYNPISIHRLLKFSMENEMPEERSYGSRDGLHFNFHFHASFSSLDAVQLKQKLAQSVHSAHSMLKSARILIITYGTSFLYQTKAHGDIVSNCHKLSPSHFDKSLLTQKQILESFEETYRQLMDLNPQLQIILTVSPVRHIKDTLELNAVSKAILRMTTHTLSEQHENVCYFPAYEIMMDDLRDYRFYADDMIHPSPAAIEYIWQKFSHQFFPENVRQFISKWIALQKAVQHRPFNGTSPQHQQFLRETLKQLSQFRGIVDVSQEIEALEKQILT